MRSLALVGLIILTTLPLAAHNPNPWARRGPRHRVVVETRPAFPCRYDVDRQDDERDDHNHGDDNRREGRWGRREDRACRLWSRHRHRECFDDDVVVLHPQPLAPPWQARIEFRFTW